jgi:GR25 family glycosyltransferase involved in LPS biosynthesis
MTSSIKSFNDIKHAFYINLEHRTDRNSHVINQLTNLGLPIFERFNAIKMDHGAAGCSMSHLKILQTALQNNYDHVLILEDDISFLNPDLFKANFNKFLERQGNNWDVILLAGNNVPPYDKIDDVCIKVKQCLTTTGYLVNGHYIKRLIDNVKLGLINLLRKPDKGILYAIDKFWFVLQGVDRWFLIIPPTVVQREDYSDIEKRNTNYQRLMTDIDKAAFYRPRYHQSP